jgi:hypothetical protein
MVGAPAVGALPVGASGRKTCRGIRTAVPRRYIPLERDPIAPTPANAGVSKVTLL